MPEHLTELNCKIISHIDNYFVITAIKVNGVQQLVRIYSTRTQAVKIKIDHLK